MTGRREFLESVMAAAAFAPGAAQAETLAVLPVEAPRHHIRFAVCSIGHDHIHAMIGAIKAAAVNWCRGGARARQAGRVRRLSSKAAQPGRGAARSLPVGAVVAGRQRTGGHRHQGDDSGQDFLSESPAYQPGRPGAGARNAIADRAHLAILYSERGGARRFMPGAVRRAPSARSSRPSTSPHQIIQRRRHWRRRARRLVLEEA